MQQLPPTSGCVFLDRQGRPAPEFGQRLFNSAQAGWQGWPLELQRIDGRGESGPSYSPHPTLAVCLQAPGDAGCGHNDVLSGGRWIRLPFRAGVTALQGQGIEFSRMAWSGTADEILALQFPPDWVAALAPEEPPPSGLVTLAPFEDTALTGLLVAIRDECRRGGSTGRLFAQGLSLALLGYLQSRYASPASAAAAPFIPGKLPPRGLARLDDYIAEHLSRDLGIEELAAQLRLSPSHFTRLFKASTGLAPYRYLQQRRMERATALLRGQDSLAEVAQQAGFANQSHFTQAFRQHTGVTPARARAELRGHSDTPARVSKRQ